jgi:hypothetical protein
MLVVKLAVLVEVIGVGGEVGWLSIVVDAVILGNPCQNSMRDKEPWIAPLHRSRQRRMPVTAGTACDRGRYYYYPEYPSTKLELGQKEHSSINLHILSSDRLPLQAFY